MLEQEEILWHPVLQIKVPVPVHVRKVHRPEMDRHVREQQPHKKEKNIPFEVVK